MKGDEEVSGGLHEGWRGSVWRGATSGTALVPSKEGGESIDLCEPSDVEDVNTKRD